MRALALSLLLCVPASIAGADTTLMTGLLAPSGIGAITQCLVVNYGTKPVQLVSSSFLTTSGPLAPDTNSCENGPIAPGESCAFAVVTGSYLGGRITVKGSTKKVRARCIVLPASGPGLLDAAEMR